MQNRRFIGEARELPLTGIATELENIRQACVLNKISYLLWFYTQEEENGRIRDRMNQAKIDGPKLDATLAPINQPAFTTDVAPDLATIKAYCTANNILLISAFYLKTDAANNTVIEYDSNLNDVDSAINNVQMRNLDHLMRIQNGLNVVVVPDIYL